MASKLMHAFDVAGAETVSSDKIEKISGLAGSSPVFGIDLGTTNSAISVVAHGDNSETIRLTDGKFTMPSCVMWKDGRFVVGQEAYQHRAQTNVIYSVKRFMQDPDKKVELVDNGKQLEMTPAEVSAEILKGLVALTGGVYGEVKDVVVTVPAYFDQNGRNATRKACELAGLNLIDIINEPTAAALCYDLDTSASGQETDFITFDFGGGTFDVTLARITDNSKDTEVMDIYGLDGSSEGGGKIIQCLAIEGDSHLGGDDVDRDMLAVLDKKLKAEEGVSVNEFSREFRETMILRLENLKKKGTDGVYSITIDDDTLDRKHISCSIMITQKDFKEALLPSYKRCRRILDLLINKIPNSARKVILVGGSTKNPILVDLLKSDYPGYEFSDAVSQDLAVTQGAAIKGKIDKFGSDSVQVFDILPIAIGVHDVDRVMTIIPSGATLPATKTHMFTTIEDNQSYMVLELLQGKSVVPEECVSLGKLRFDGIPPAPAGKPQLFVTITINADSRMTCVGEVNGEKQTLKLDLTGETTQHNSSGIGDSGLSERDKKLKKRWLRTAEKLPAEKKAVLLDLINGFPDFVSRTDINNYLRDNTEALKEVD